MPTPTKKKNSCASTKALVIIIGAVALVLLFALFTREQTVKSLKVEKSALQKTNAELQQTLDDGKKMSLAQRLGAAGIDTLNLWKFENEGCQEPYCRAIRVEVDGVEDFSSMIKGLQRWNGFVTPLDISEESSCEAFAVEGGAVVPVNLDLLADVEKKILRSSTEKNLIEITAYVTEYSSISCDTPAQVLNVHLE